MNIRRKIFLSYIFFVLLAASLMLMLFLFTTVQQNIEEDIKRVYEAKEIWNDLLISMNELQINWADGRTYEHLVERYVVLEQLLADIAEERSAVPFSGDYDLAARKVALYNTWSMARESIESIIRFIEEPDFQRIVHMVEKQPGLQRLNHLWMDLFYNSGSDGKKDAYVIENVINNVEFFPIYSDTLNHLFNTIISETDEAISRMETVSYFSSMIFFLVFILLAMRLAYNFTRSISKPIIDLSIELSAFMGKTLKIESYTHTDELHLLEVSVNNLIEHYTYLAELAGRLAVGELNSPIMELREQGVVGNALKDINRYLKELAETSEWIEKGNYGAEVRIKSDVDILAKNFNIMSKVVHEKITTLSNMFEAVAESIVVLDHQGEMVETNSNFQQMIGADMNGNSILSEENIYTYFKDKKDLDAIIAGENRKVLYTDLKDKNGNTVPVKILPRSMPKVPEQSDKLMLFITNESMRMRAEREKEQLRAQAVEAELRALRAQINPHFLFNTLNAIAHLAESRPENAVRMIEKLSDLFRYSLASTRRFTVSLSEELEIITQFLDIEKMRFGDNLKVECRVENDISQMQIPPMLIQPIVENAVKYGVDQKGKINIEIMITKKEKGLHISISDQGAQEFVRDTFMQQKGTGIFNVNRRLRSLYNQQLIFEQNTPQGLKVVFEIPEEGGRDGPFGHY